MAWILVALIAVVGVCVGIVAWSSLSLVYGILMDAIDPPPKG